MAMFKGFKPQGLQKIASRMGYAGRMEEFDNYLEQNPEKQREMITYQAKAQEMANGGLLKFQPQNPGGETSKQAKFAPMYNQFKESDFYKDSQKGIGATVTGGAMVDGQNYNFGMRKEAEAYKKYLDSLGYGTQKVGEATYYNTPKAVAFGGAPVGRPSDMEQFPIADFEPMPQQVDTPTGLPNYVNPIKTGGGAGGLGTPGASVMQYGYNPTTNQYSLSGGGSNIFPRGFESSMSPDELYKKYPNIKGVFERGVPISTPGGEGGGLNEPLGIPMGQIPVINPRDPIDFQKQRLEEVKDSLAPEIYDRYYAGLYGELPKLEDPKDANTTGTTRGRSLGSTTPVMRNPIAREEYMDYFRLPDGGKFAYDRRTRIAVPPGAVGISKDEYSKIPDKRTDFNSLVGVGQPVQPEQNPGIRPEQGGNITSLLPQAPNPSGQRPVFGQGEPVQILQPTGPNMATDTNIEDFSVQQALNPTLPQGGATVAVDTPVTQAQMIDPKTGQLMKPTPTVSSATLANTSMSTAPTATPASTMDASLSNLNVTQALQPIQSAQGSVSQQAQLDAQQQTASKVSELKAAQGTATLMQNPVQRQVQAGELISGGVADAQTASTYAEQIQAAEATPSAQATVQGQLANLTTNFDASNPPAWAAGALRGIQAQMANRGLGASSIAAQAMVQGALESALPIAQADANTIASFEQANLSNRQQRAMLSAQQRATFIGQEFDQAFQTRVQNAAKIGDIANMNFTAEQNIALENSKAVNTMGLANLSNNQAMVIAEASALANLDMSNLNNRQQAAVQNAQSFMQMDMANLNNNQQTDMFKAQSIVQSLFNDQSATNASNQFNATSQNQTDQFFANLASTVANFNAEQSNAMSRYNSGELNALEQFNSTMKNQREQFNAQNRLVIDQSNAQWRRQVATSDTATVNRVNELNARALIDLSTGAYNNLWQGFRDDMEFSWKTNDNALERAKDITLRRMQDESTVAAAALAGDQKMVDNLTNGLLSLATTDTGNTMVGTAFDFVSGIDYGSIWDTGSKWLSDLF